MTYYEEDQPDTSERFGRKSVEEQREEWVEKIKDAIEREKPLIVPEYTVPRDKSQERHEELMEMLGGIFVQLSRVYDVLMFVVTPEQQHTIDQLHSRGELFASPPSLKEDAWNETETKVEE